MIFAEWYKKYYSILFFVIAAFAAMLILPAEGKFKYEYQKGRPWLYETLIAPVDFPILKSEQELRAERSMAASKSPACYNVEQEAMISTREELLTFFSASLLANSVASLSYIRLGLIRDSSLVNLSLESVANSLIKAIADSIEKISAAGLSFRVKLLSEISTLERGFPPSILSVIPLS